MLFSLAIMYLFGLLLAEGFRIIKLPRILGMLICGILLGPFVFNLIDPSILTISPVLRKIALIIILLRAGLSLDFRDVKAVGRPALLLSFLPALFEVLAYVFIAPTVLGITRLEAAIIGAVMGAVSPAVVVPKMVQLMEQRCGTDKRIPQLMLAGSSLDDVFVIVLFSSFISMAQGRSVNASDFLNIPISIVLGIAIGAVSGLMMSIMFKKFKPENSVKVILLLSISFLLTALEEYLEGYISVSGLIAVMTMAMLLNERSNTDELSKSFKSIWTAAEVMLFVLIGAAVDIRYTLNAGLSAIIMLFIALFFRSIGVVLSMLGTNLNIKERLFCIISYLPKATVQAAIGGVPLSLGLGCGNLVLSVAVVAILITAPLGAVGMELTYKKLLHTDNSDNLPLS